MLDVIDADTAPSSFDPIVSLISLTAITKADHIDLKLGSLRKDYPGVPIMALTATAQDKVQDDIIRSLGIQGCEKLKQSFNRPNLNYEVRPKKKELLKEIVGFIGTQERGASGIIYCSSRDKCEEVAMQLKQTYNIRARHYHAGMPKNDRRAAQEDWQDHKFEIIVATVSYPANMERRS
jgi:bloom syndrome protein